MSEKLNQIGEEEILNRLKYFMPLGQINDDTAQINSFGKDALVNTDVLVEDIHFSERTTSPEDIGWRAIATNISDLAASGVETILGVTVGLVAPPATDWKCVKGVYTGMKEALTHFGGEFLGGDLSRGQQKLLSITALGAHSCTKPNA